ncbi:MAG: tryptophan synthase subunit alpha [Bacteroidetes bacterium]|nr:tryptophan synthase subunit alpha [Bacteroidota bacterium]
MSSFHEDHQSRVTKRLLELRRKNRKAFAVFLTAGYPSLDSTLPLVRLCDEAGIDILELGMPFSDPLADGPIIQACSQQALNNGVTLSWILEQVQAIREFTNLPLVLMGYLNPIFRYGVEKFFRDASSVGVDGVILPEVPLEEVHRFSHHARANSIDIVLLVSPTTPISRIKEIDKTTSGFLYCVSSTGVTGHSTTVDEVRAYVVMVKELAVHPVLVGFGIRSAEHAQQVASVADGVIIGSEFLTKIRSLGQTNGLQMWIRKIRESL